MYELVSIFYADPVKGFLLIQTVLGDARQDSGEGAAGLTDSGRIQEPLGRIALSLRFVIILYSVLRIRTVFRDPDLQNFP
jgi:hypothetical protein